MFDKPTGIEACLDSYNWLSAFDGTGRDTVVNVSVPTTAPGFSPRCAGARPVSGRALNRRRFRAPLTGGECWPVSLRETPRGKLGKRDRGVPKRETSVRLIFDREHEAILREWSATAQHRLLVLSHRLGPAAESRLVRSGESSPTLFTVGYGHSELDEEWLSKIDGMVRRVGEDRPKPHMHAKVLVSDTSACISSYNFLSADPFGTARRARELGVVLEGGEVATWLAERLALAIPDATQKPVR